MMRYRMLACGVTFALAATSALTQTACGDKPADKSAATAEPAPAPAPAAPAAQAPAPAATSGQTAQPPATTAPATPRSRPARSQQAARAAETAPPPAAEPAPPPPPPPPPPPKTFTLAADTAIAVYTTSTLSTNANQTGEPFRATLAKAITDGDWVIAKQGATVEGVIVESDPGGRVKGVASMTVALKSLRLADGRTIALSTNTLTADAKSTKGKDAKKIGIGTGVGAAIGAIAGGGKGAAIGAAVGGGAGTASALATRGDAATVPSESLLTFQLTSSVTIVERR